ncbi:hypothetical protein B0J14DRAFT_67706 [Halenospora varia]|nr:hypothetical protein B0J14DRAFT_67706 [Halenospora varia]
MHLLSSISVVVAALSIAAALPQVDVLSQRTSGNKKGCKPFSGNFTIEQYQLYPENADFDFKSCLLYIGVLWNATVGIYDPYTNKMLEVLEFPGISHDPQYHIGGVGVDKKSGLVSIVVDYGAAFTAGDISGTNFIMQWDPVTRQTNYKINLTDTTHAKYGGFQDVEQDPEGNVYVVGTFPSSILKVDKKGKKVTPWFVSQPVDPKRSGFAGLAANGWILLANDADSKIWKFDMRAPKGVPVEVPHSPNVTWSFTDAIYLPPRHKGTVLLVAEDLGGVIVLRSKDGKWNSAEYLGTVPNPVPNAFVTAAGQVGESLYLIPTDVGNSSKPNTAAGNQSHFPFIDITAQVDALLKA